MKRDTDVTFFGSASLIGDIEDWTLTAIYNRQQATGSGDGLATSLDSVFLEAEFHPERNRWSTFLAFRFDRRRTITRATEIDFEVVAGADGVSAERTQAFTAIANRRQSRDNFTAIAGVRGAINRNLEGTAEFRYRRFQNNDSNVDLDGVDIFFAVVTFEYYLDPFRF